MTQPTITLNDGRAIPQVGLGVWQTPNDIAAPTVVTALQAGYRHVDTAAIYGNERGVGEGLREAGVAREEMFVTTKLWNDRQGYDSALKAFDNSLSRLGLDYLDLYLIHWPAPAQDLYLETWKALVRLRQDGRVRSIGVSNFGEAQLERIIGETGVTPVLNQIELHPRWQQRRIHEFHRAHGIATESWSPLGQGQVLTDPVVERIAQKHGRTPAQVVIRWHLDSGLVVIPKSVTPSRICENIDVFGFTLDDEDRAQIAGMDDPRGRIGPDPQRFS